MKRNASITKFLFLNQMAGPLFRELAIDLSNFFIEKSILYTGHPDSLVLGPGSNLGQLTIMSAPVYDRKSKCTRLFSWLNYSVRAFFKVMLADKGAVIVIVSNPPLLGLVTWLATMLRDRRYIVLVYDLHPDTLVSFGVLSEGGAVTRIWRAVNRIVWERADAVFTLGDVMAKRLSNQFDANETELGHVGVVPPWADTDLIKPIDKVCNKLAEELGQINKLTVLYSGNMGVSHDIESMLQAAKLLRSDEGISFLFIGEGAKWQEAFDFVESEGLKNVQVLPFQPEDRLPYTMALADISLVALDKGAEGLMVPSKMYYYMAAGSAVVGICEGINDLQTSIEKGACGLVVRPNDPRGLAKAILDLSEDEDKLLQLRSNARKASVAYYSRRAGVAVFVESLSKIGVINVLEKPC